MIRSGRTVRRAESVSPSATAIADERASMAAFGFPVKQGLYDPTFEHDSCGVGFVVDIKGRRSHDTVEKALTVLANLEHRGASGAEKNTGDGAGILVQMPHHFFRVRCDQGG